MSEDEAVEVDPETEEDDPETEQDDPETEQDDPETADHGDADGGAAPAETDAGSGDSAEGEMGADTSVTLVDRVAEHDEALAADVEALVAERDEYEAEIDELTSKLARVRADFSNYKQRAKRKQEEIRERASESLVERIVPVRNDLLRALDQEDGSDIRPGVESTLEKFDEVLSEEGVEPIDPDPGTEVDPKRHQVMLRVDSDRPEGTVHEVYEPGYEMGDRVIVEAQITVSDGD